MKNEKAYQLLRREVVALEAYISGPGGAGARLSAIELRISDLEHRLRERLALLPDPVHAPAPSASGSPGLGPLATGLAELEICLRELELQLQELELER